MKREPVFLCVTVCLAFLAFLAAALFCDSQTPYASAQEEEEEPIQMMPNPLERHTSGDRGIHEMTAVEGDAQRIGTQGSMKMQKLGTKGAEVDPAAAGMKAGEMKGKMNQTK